jgi:GT2 family glycosyltransferase
MGDTVAAIIPTFDRQQVLPRALDSVLGQTVTLDEVIVVDDGSQDGTRELIGERYPQITLISQNNRGVSAARNTGIRAATADWIALLDSDDEWRPNKIARQLEALSGRDEPLCHTEEIWIRNGRRVNQMKKHQKQGGHIYERCLPLCVISPSSALIRRDLLLSIGLFDESLPACEDYDLWLRICARYPVLFVDEPLLVKYGGHPDQLSRRYFGMDRFRITALEKALQSGALDASQQSATRRILLEKIDIYCIGAQKRGRDEDVARYQQKAARWREKSAIKP